MKIVYMGTPDFAVPALKELHAAGYEIPLVITRPDQQRDRGKQLKPTPVKEAAQELGIPVLTPERVRMKPPEGADEEEKAACRKKGDPELMEVLRKIQPDMIVVAAYGMILPRELLRLPQFGCINIHASLLPRWRGAAPIQHAIWAGDEKTGVSIMYMEEGMDTGAVISKTAVSTAGKTAEYLTTELAYLGAQMVNLAIQTLMFSVVRPEYQNEEEATFAPMITKQDGLVDFKQTAKEIECQIRAMYAWPCAYTYYLGQPMKLLAAVDPKDAPLPATDEEPGTVLAVSPAGVDFACGDGSVLRVTRIQMPNKKAMDVSEYIKGNAILAGTLCTQEPALVK